MQKLLCTIIVAVLLIKSYSSTSIAEEINSGVSNMRESIRTEPTIHYLQEMIEQDDLDENIDDSDTSPSEIIETHVLPDGNDADDLTSQIKRPRKRRRRRRRKRPKTTENPTVEESETYHTLPEEELRNKPLKYKPLDVVTEEIIPNNNSNLLRRRNAKRRRRPIKRPTIDDYQITEADPLIANYPNNTEIQVSDYNNNNNNNDQLINENHKKYKNSLKEETEEMQATFFLRDEGTNFQKIPLNARKSSNQIKENEQPKILLQNELNANHRRRKRPNYPRININDTATENTKYEINSTQIVKSDIDQEYNENRKNTSYNKFNELIINKPSVSDENVVNIKIKTDDEINAKLNDTNKEIFKLRRMPPTSTILRHTKIKPNFNSKNETQHSKTAGPKIETNSTKSEENSTYNEIVPNKLVNQEDAVVYNTNVEKITKNNQSISKIKSINDQKSSYSVYEEETENTTHADDSFEFPVITNANTKQSLKQVPTTSSSIDNSTAENSTIIYILCNHTIDKALKNKLNLTNITLSAKSKFVKVLHNFSIPITNTTIRKEIDFKPSNLTDDQKLNILKTISVEDLEKLLFEDEHIPQSNLQVNKNSMVTNSSNQKNNFNNKGFNLTRTIHSLDESESEMHFNYQSQNKSQNTVTQTNKFTQIDLQNLKLTTEQYSREPKRFQHVPKYKFEKEHTTDTRKYPLDDTKLSPSLSNELIISYTSTSNPNSIFNEIIPEQTVYQDEFSLHLVNNSFYRKTFQESITQRNKSHIDRKKLPLAVKSAIIISGAILALAVLGFFALLLSCKIRQAKSRMKCHRELYREQLQNSEFRQSSRSTSPVVSKTNFYGRNFTNNIQSNIASNRNYYLWQTLRKTFQYD